MIECVVPSGAMLGESPVWSAGEGLLYWVDIDGMHVHRYDPATGVDVAVATPGRPGSLALTSNPGTLLVAAENGLGHLDFDTGAYEPWIDLEEPGIGNRLNDGRCDPAGRFWVGSMYADTSQRRFSGMLHRVDPDGSVATLKRDLGVSNGLAFSPDGETMYHADSPHATVWAATYDLETGTARDERVFSDFAGLPGRPDGACVDESGCYWIACLYGWAVARLTPDGRIDRIVELPIEKPTMPAFGDADLSTLYVTSIGSSRPADPREVESGGVYAISAGVKGLAEPHFAS